MFLVREKANRLFEGESMALPNVVLRADFHVVPESGLMTVLMGPQQFCGRASHVGCTLTLPAWVLGSGSTVRCYMDAP